MYYAGMNAATERQAKALEEAVPSARVVRVRGAHYIFLSNESETLRATRAFLAGLNSRCLVAAGGEELPQPSLPIRERDRRAVSVNGTIRMVAR
jgi:hypothetical protein